MSATLHETKKHVYKDAHAWAMAGKTLFNSFVKSAPVNGGAAIGIGAIGMMKDKLEEMDK